LLRMFRAISLHVDNDLHCIIMSRLSARSDCTLCTICTIICRTPGNSRFSPELKAVAKLRAPPLD
jgi:hypothetical protein